MVGRSVPLTKADKARMERLHAMRCVACVKESVRQPSRTEAHHLLSGGKRRGHQCTIPLCGWHHRGECSGSRKQAEMRRTYGPSFALESKEFRRIYGSDDILLAEVDQYLTNLPPAPSLRMGGGDAVGRDLSGPVGGFSNHSGD